MNCLHCYVFRTLCDTSYNVAVFPILHSMQRYINALKTTAKKMAIKQNLQGYIYIRCLWEISCELVGNPKALSIPIDHSWCIFGHCIGLKTNHKQTETSSRQLCGLVLFSFETRYAKWSTDNEWLHEFIISYLYLWL